MNNQTPSRYWRLFSIKSISPFNFLVKSLFFFFLLFATVLAVGAFTFESAKPPVYIDPILETAVSPQVSVIVTANSSETAAQAVKAVDGTVTSDLWLIDAVGATIAADKIHLLAETPGVLSITENQPVKTADYDPYAWEGWVTDRRNFTNVYPLSGEMWFLPLTLPDGGIFTMIEKGDGYILNMDGSIRASFSLNGKPFRSEPVLGPDGRIYVAGKTRVYSINPDGSIYWQAIAGVDKFEGGIGVNDDAVFVSNASQTVIALDINNGQNLWSFQYSLPIDDKITVPPAVGADGTVYIISEFGYLKAINPVSGEVLWTFVADQGADYVLKPIVDYFGTIYITGISGKVYAINNNGSLKYSFSTSSSLLASPILDSDNTLFIGTDSGELFAINSDGSVRFQWQAAGDLKFEASPALSRDETQVFVGAKDSVLFALDTSNGTLNWSHVTPGGLVASPIVAANGNIHLGDKSGAYEIITPDGLVVYRYTGFSQFLVSPTVSNDGSVFFHDNKVNIVVLARRPEEWDATIPHVEPTNDPIVYKVANPVSIDLGADIAHENGVTGNGVTVAVIDSGVYFDANTQTTLGTAVQDNFLGQADFVGAINCTATNPNGGCFTDYTNSQDGYGHGSHVAGIIWNNVEDYYTGATVGIAPNAQVLSIRVLGDDGSGTYEDVIEGIQYAVANKDEFNIRVMNLSLSSWARSPYFADPLNRAVEEAWAAGIVVLAAAGNQGPYAESITVPGNDPYVITIGAVDSNKTPGYWADDNLANFSSTGPTLDGFVKPDLVVPGGNVVSYMYNDGDSDPETSSSPALVLAHPDYSINSSMFRMNGTSMSTAVASGVVALILEAYPTMTPNQVKYRLMAASQTAVANQQLMYSPLQQGIGRIWVPDAIFSDIPLLEANSGMDIEADLAHGWLKLDEEGNPVRDEAGDYILDETELAYHYQGEVQKIISDDGQTYLYYTEDPTDGSLVVLGAADLQTLMWIEYDDLMGMGVTFDNVSNGTVNWPHADAWSNGIYNWAGGIYNWAGGIYNWAGGIYNWAGGIYNWAGGIYNWAGGIYNWAGGIYNWAGGIYNWAGGIYNWAGGIYNWAGGIYNWAGNTGVSSTTWVGEGWATRTPTMTPIPPTGEPTATNTPLPTATSTAEPTATNTALPTATSTSEPTATNTPLPTATVQSTPIPTSTPEDDSQPGDEVTNNYTVFLPLITK